MRRRAFLPGAHRHVEQYIIDMLQNPIPIINYCAFNPVTPESSEKISRESDA